MCIYVDVNDGPVCSVVAKQVEAINGLKCSFGHTYRTECRAKTVDYKNRSSSSINVVIQSVLAKDSTNRNSSFSNDAIQSVVQVGAKSQFTCTKLGSHSLQFKVTQLCVVLHVFSSFSRWTRYYEITRRHIVNLKRTAQYYLHANSTAP